MVKAGRRLCMLRDRVLWTAWANFVFEKMSPPTLHMLVEAARRFLGLRPCMSDRML